MGRRKPHSTAPPVEVVDVDMPVSARVAWSYLAALLATIAAGLLAALSSQSLAAVACAGAGGDDGVAACKLGLVIWTGIGGFVLCLLPAALGLGLGWWLWVTLSALASIMITLDAVTAWWWWVAAALLPALAALASARWSPRPVLRRVQIGLILGLVGAAAVALVIWYRNG